MEVERRFKVSKQEYDALLTRIEWSTPDRVCDLTFGPSGPTSMQTHGWVVRLRQTSAGTRMEYKAPRNAEWSAWTEYSTSVGSFPETIRILAAIGLQTGLLLDRTRRVATLQSATLSLDDVLGLGLFIEIEVEAGGDDEEQALKAIEEIRESLGLESNPDRPYGEILLARLTTDAAFRDEHERLIADLLRYNDGSASTRGSSLRGFNSGGP
jgi:predicted adenylyl cyclase CyaB